MILADKIIHLRKKVGWSQEELANQLGVTRQSVSKWEGAQSIPDMDKIIQMSRIFGVTTDFLLKDEFEEETAQLKVCDDSKLRKVSMIDASNYLSLRKAAAPKIALATFLCVISPTPLIMLGGMSEVPKFRISENLAGGLGLCLLMILVAVAVAVFLSCSSKVRNYDFLEKEPFETEYGVTGMVKAKKSEFESTYSRLTIIGTVLCILSVIPLFSAICFDAVDLVFVAAVCCLLILAGIGVYLFVLGGVYKSAISKLLEEDDYSREKKSKSKIKSAVTVCYWLVVTAIFIIYNNSPNTTAKSSWIIWAVAGLVYGGLAVAMNSIVRKSGE